MRLFGKAKKEPQQVSPIASIQRLKETLSMLEKREEHLTKRAERERAFAKANAAKNHKGALLALKRKKMYEAEITKLSGTQLTVEQQIIALEGATVTLETVQAMREGATTVRTMQSQLDINRVDDIMEDVRESIEAVNEAQESLATPIGGEMFDDEDLEEELRQLQEESVNDQLHAVEQPAVAAPAAAAPAPAGAPATQPAQPVAATAATATAAAAAAAPPAMPSAPTSSLPDVDEDELELQQLKASVALPQAV